MEIYLHNTLTGKKELFQPIVPGHVSMYNCGPTVYGPAHIGNFRTFILNDLLRRMCEYNTLEVTQVMNITDVDDKTIRKSQEERVSLSTVTQKYEKMFLHDLQLLNIKLPHKTPRATGAVTEMITMIETLLDQGVAYTAGDGVYFNIAKSKDYGALARLDLTQSVQERIPHDEYDKENPRDFALWKFYTEDDGDVLYDAPFGKGRPGWHIECSAMCVSALGETIDIHTGGSDLVFPHHTNEIAQSEAVTGKQFVHYWVHGGFITVDGKKMSKSLGNIFTLEDFIAKGIDPLAYRYFVLTAHYTTLLNFTWDAVSGSQTALRRLREVASKTVFDATVMSEIDSRSQEYKKRFLEYINDDLDTPKALALVWEVVKDSEISDTDKQTLILDFDRVFGLQLDKKEIVEIPEEVQSLITARDIARAEKDFTHSDDLRGEIEHHGFEVMDTPEGTKVFRA